MATVKGDASRWLFSNFNVTGENILASKFYIPEQSWTKRPVWWLEIPQKAIDETTSNKIHLLCQIAPGAKEFHYLKGSVEFLQKSY